MTGDKAGGTDHDLMPYVPALEVEVVRHDCLVAGSGPARQAGRRPLAARGRKATCAQKGPSCCA
jgi:hypothetical protein